MKTIKISNHQVSGTDAYLFDTNVWLYIYGPIAGAHKWKQGQYAKLFKGIIDGNARVFITLSIISEYINRVLRLGFAQWKDANWTPAAGRADYKTHYRPTQDYKDTLTDVIAQVKEIMSKTKPLTDDFNSINLNVVLDMMEKDADFNDAYMIKSCESKGIILVSDDRDIQNIDSRICLITA